MASQHRLRPAARPSAAGDASRTREEGSPEIFGRLLVQKKVSSLAGEATRSLWEMGTALAAHRRLS